MYQFMDTQSREHTNANKLESFRKHRWILILPVVIVGILLGVGIINYNDAVNKQKAKDYYYNPHDYSQSYIDASNKMLADQAPLIEENKNIGKLVSEMPYKGTLFAMDFDYQHGHFVANLSKAKKTEADAEFDAYLKSKGISSKDHIMFLEVNYK